jgi:linoleate 10R-lipoxygenase
MSSRPSSKFLSRPSTINPIKSSSSTTQPYENEAAVKTFQNAFKKSLASYNEPSLVAAAIDALLHIDSINDRLMGLEYIISFLSENADGILKDQVAALETKMVEILYDDLHHPPATYIGAEYQYRSADGSNNNVCVPEMGKASTPYARSVQQMHPISLDTLPDPGLVFDTLLKRQKFTMHPAGLSSMMFSWAALVIHTVFRTSQDNVSINETSSYVDLAPLYGNDPKALNEIRVHDGRGLMLPDTFAEDRLLLLPPAVCVLLVLFNRNHNVGVWSSNLASALNCYL